mmetsp:Transcript_4282/g.9125  ORF Transcript_4282/g.9125 Transcript_4282/m.9125 type:complete len:202 (-) Transcript_4282:34-639(-)
MTRWGAEVPPSLAVDMERALAAAGIRLANGPAFLCVWAPCWPPRTTGFCCCSPGRMLLMLGHIPVEVFPILPITPIPSPPPPVVAAAAAAAVGATGAPAAIRGCLGAAFVLLSSCCWAFAAAMAAARGGEGGAGGKVPFSRDSFVKNSAFATSVPPFLGDASGDDSSGELPWVLDPNGLFPVLPALLEAAETAGDVPAGAP